MIETFNQQQFVDLFGDVNTQVPPTTPSFGMNNNNDTDILDTPPAATTTPVVELNEDGTPKEEEVVLNEDGTPKEEVNTDILTENRPGRKPKYDFTDTSGYFQDRFKSGKFVAVEQEEEDGTVKQFIPKTPEEFDEVIDLQVNYQLEQRAKELEKNWYSTKSPAWQAVAKFADMTDDPTEIVPFLQGIKTMESVNNINPEDLAGAEKIVRIRLEQRGDDEEIINEQIDALKTTDKLISTAQKYKPAILQQEKHQLNQMLAEKQQQEQEYAQMVVKIRENAIKAIEAPIFGKQKLKQEEKAIVYDMIAEPSQETKGYKIYTEIDKLFEAGDFEKLKMVALILGKEEALKEYIALGASNKTAKELQTKLRVAADSRAGSSGDDPEAGEGRGKIMRNQYSSPRFGR